MPKRLRLCREAMSGKSGDRGPEWVTYQELDCGLRHDTRARQAHGSLCRTSEMTRRWWVRTSASLRRGAQTVPMGSSVGRTAQCTRPRAQLTSYLPTALPEGRDSRFSTVGAAAAATASVVIRPARAVTRCPAAVELRRPRFGSSSRVGSATERRYASMPRRWARQDGPRFNRNVYFSDSHDATSIGPGVAWFGLSLRTWDCGIGEIPLGSPVRSPHPGPWCGEIGEGGKVVLGAHRRCVGG